MSQQDLWGLLPGAPGGRALRDQRGSDYLYEIAARGGTRTVKRYGPAYMRQLASKGGKAKRNKLYTQPATIQAWDGTIQRRVPWWPHQPGRRRRKRPVLVRIEVGEVI